MSRTVAPPAPSPLRYYTTTLLPALAFCVLSVFILWHEWGQAQRSAETSVLNTARVVANEIENSFNQVDALLRSAGQRFMNASALDVAALERFETEVSAEVRYYPLVERIGFTDAAGLTRFNTAFGRHPQHRPNLSDRDYFARARAGETGLIFDGPVRARLQGEWSLILARRLPGPDGEFHGVVFAVVTVEAIGRYFSRVELGPGGVINLRTADLVQVVRYPALSGDGGGIGNRNVSETLRRLLRAEPGLDHYLYQTVAPTDGVERIYAVQRFGHAPFLMMVGRGTAELAEAWRATAASLVLLCLAVTLILVWVARRLHGAARQFYDQNRWLEKRVGERTTELESEKAALQRSQAQLAAVLDASPVAVALYDDQEHITYFNPAFVSLFGYTLKDTPTVAAWWRQAYPDPVYRETLATAWHERLATSTRTGRPFAPLEAEIRAKDGTLKTVLGHFVALSMRALNLVTLVDISQQRAAARRMELLLETASDGIHILDEDGWVVECSDSFAQMLGYTREEARRLIVTDWEAQIPAEHFPSTVRTLIAGADTFETRHRRKDGTVFDVEIHSKGIVLDGRRLLYASSRDITERKRLEQQLRLSEERYRLIAEHASDFIFTMNLEGRVLYASPSAGRIYGFTAEEVMGQSLAEMLTPASLAIAEAGLVQAGAALAAGRPMAHLRLELEEYRKDGSTLWTETSANGVYDTEGRFVEILGITRDISQRKHDEQELQRARAAAEAASAAKSAFLAHMSHEIRTPMNAVLGLAQVLERGVLAPDQCAMVMQIGTAARSLLGILNDILDLSKIEAGQLVLEERPFTLAPLLAQIDALLGSRALERGLTLAIEAPAPTDAGLVGDPLRLQQVLLNLVGNAIKFTEHGAVRVRIETLARDPSGSRMRFTVSDTGIGIAPDQIAGLFDPFTQADGSITRRFGGTGLGLSICKRLVEQMGGAIGAASTPGEGSTFWFEITFGRAEQVPPLPFEPPPAPAPAGPRLAGLHLLIVDDSVMNREVTERMLALEGARATLAADGGRALEVLRAQPRAFDAVLMDVQMPVMDGLTATRIIRADLGLADLPVIALTAGVLPEQQAAARAAGVNEVLSKPLELERLVAALLPWVGPRRAAPAVAVRVNEVDASDDFPDLPGIDRAWASRATQGSRSLLIRLLGTFTGQFSGLIDQVRTDLAAGDRASAARRLHTLKGDAATLGALSISAGAERLERCLTDGTTLPETELDALGEQVSALIAAGAPLNPAVGCGAADGDRAGAGPGLEPARLDELAEALRARDLGALAVFASLRPALADALGEARSVELDRAIRSLRFEEALDLLIPPPGAPDRSPPESQSVRLFAD